MRTMGLTLALVGCATERDADTAVTAEDKSQLQQPYTYSDMTGFSLSGTALPSGGSSASCSVVCAGHPEWNASFGDDWEDCVTYLDAVNAELGRGACCIAD